MHVAACLLQLLELSKSIEKNIFLLLKLRVRQDIVIKKLA